MKRLKQGRGNPELPQKAAEIPMAVGDKEKRLALLKDQENSDRFLMTSPTSPQVNWF